MQSSPSQKNFQWINEAALLLYGGRTVQDFHLIPSVLTRRGRTLADKLL